MKKLLFSLLAAALLFSSCIDEEPPVINNIYQGSYVYREYVEVAANQWTPELDIISSTLHRTSCLYYDYPNEYINEDLIDGSFVTVYRVENGYDVVMPNQISYTDAVGGSHQARFSYNVHEGYVRIVLESLDGTYDDLQAFLNTNLNPAHFKVCMVIND